MTDAADPARAERVLRCSANPNLPATAFCTVCGQPFSGKFLGVRSDGRSACFSCARRDGITLRERPSESDNPRGLGERWWRVVYETITAPRTALTDLDGRSLAQAVFLGYLATLVGFAATQGWNTVFHGDAMLADLRVALGDDVDAQLLPMLPWLLLPVAAALRLGAGALFLYFGVWIRRRDATSLQECLAVFAIGSTTLVLCAVPYLGPFLALVTWISATLAWLQSRHEMRTIHALMSVLPCLLVVAALGPNTYVA